MNEIFEQIQCVDGTFVHLLKLKMQFLIDFRKSFSGFSCWNVLELNPAFLEGLTMPERGTLRTKTEEAEEKCEGTERN